MQSGVEAAMANVGHRHRHQMWVMDVVRENDEERVARAPLVELLVILEKGNDEEGRDGEGIVSVDRERQD